jgi:hypothetical protein
VVGADSFSGKVARAFWATNVIAVELLGTFGSQGLHHMRATAA